MVDAELRWLVLRRLAALGRAEADRLDAELRRDPTAAGERQHAAALAARPLAAAKEQAFAVLTEPAELTNDLARAVASGFWQRGQEELFRPWAARYFAALPGIWASRGPAVAQQITRLLYPRLDEPETLALDRRLPRRPRPAARLPPHRPRTPRRRRPRSAGRGRRLRSAQAQLAGRLCGPRCMRLGTYGSTKPGSRRRPGSRSRSSRSAIWASVLASGAPQAEVDAAAEREVPVLARPPRVEVVRLLERRVVPVRRPDEREDLRAGRDRHPGDLHVEHGPAIHPLDRRVHPAASPRPRPGRAPGPRRPPPRARADAATASARRAMRFAVVSWPAKTSMISRLMISRSVSGAAPSARTRIRSLSRSSRPSARRSATAAAR